MQKEIIKDFGSVAEKIVGLVADNSPAGRQHLQKIFQEVDKKYQSNLLAIWTGWRSRGKQIKEAETQLSRCQDSLSSVQTVLDFILAPGNWEITSANTQLLLRLIKSLPEKEYKKESDDYLFKNVIEQVKPLFILELNKKITKLVKELGVVAEKIVLLIADTSDEGQKRLVDIFKDVEKKYHNNSLAIWTGWRGRGKQISQAENDLILYKDSITHLQTILNFIENKDGGWESTSANTQLLIHLINALPEYKKEKESYLFKCVIEPLKELLIKELKKKINEYNQICHETAQKNISLEAQRAIKVKDLPNVFIVSDLETAQTQKTLYPDRQFFCLLPPVEKKGWQLFWINKIGQVNFLPKLQLNEVLKNYKKLPSETSQAYQELKTACTRILQESNTENFFLFDDSDKAKVFAQANPDKYSFYIKALSEPTPILGYSIKTETQYNPDEKSKGKAIYLALTGPDTLRYSFLSNNQLQQAGVLTRQELKEKNRLDDKKIDKLFELIQQNKKDVNLHPYQQLIVSITAQRGHTPKNPASYQIVWYDVLGQQTILNMTSPFKNPSELTLNSASYESYKFKANLVMLVNEFFDKISLMINPSAKMNQFTNTYVLRSEPQLTLTWYDAGGEGYEVDLEANKALANWLSLQPDLETADIKVIKNYVRHLNFRTAVNADYRANVEKVVINQLQTLSSNAPQVISNKTAALCQQDDAFSIEKSDQFKPDSYVISFQQQQWHLYYINALQKVLPVNMAEVEGLSALVNAWSTNQADLTKLGEKLVNYRPAVKLEMAKYSCIKKLYEEKSKLLEDLTVQENPEATTEVPLKKASSNQFPGKLFKTAPKTIYEAVLLIANNQVNLES